MKIPIIMITFFRKIRETMIDENKSASPVGRYLLYAIGEIVLVVIGILIALQINNQNEAAKSTDKELKYLKNIEVEVSNDSISLEKSWFQNKPKKIEYLNLARRFIMGSYIPEDTLLFINKVSFGGINSRASFQGTSRAYQELVSTGNLSLISNDNIRNRIVDYYAGKAFIKEYIENIRSDYASYVNSLKVYHTKNPDSINIEEIPRILKKIKTDEFHSLINQELTYTYSVDKALVNNKKSANTLQVAIEQFLKDQ